MDNYYPSPPLIPGSGNFQSVESIILNITEPINFDNLNTSLLTANSLISVCTITEGTIVGLVEPTTENIHYAATKNFMDSYEYLSPVSSGTIYFNSLGPGYELSPSNFGFVNDTLLNYNTTSSIISVSENVLIQESLSFTSNIKFNVVNSISPFTLTLPNSNGSVGQVISTDSNGLLSFVSNNVPYGSNYTIQYATSEGNFKSSEHLLWVTDNTLLIDGIFNSSAILTNEIYTNKIEWTSINSQGPSINVNTNVDINSNINKYTTILPTSISISGSAIGIIDYSLISNEYIMNTSFINPNTCEISGIDNGISYINTDGISSNTFLKWVSQTVYMNNIKQYVPYYFNSRELTYCRNFGPLITYNDVYIYTLSSSQLSIIDISDIYNPVLIHNIDLREYYVDCTDLVEYEDTLYIAGQYQVLTTILLIFDISRVYPVLINKINLKKVINYLTIYDSYLYGTQSNLSKYSLEDKYNPVFLSSLNIFVNFITKVNDYIYTGSDDILHIIDDSTTNLIQVNTVTVPPASFQITSNNSYVFLSSATDITSTIDISVSTSPVVVQNTSMPYSIDFDIYNNYLVIYSPDNILIYDISDPLNITLFNTYNSLVGRFTINNDRLYFNSIYLQTYDFFNGQLTEISRYELFNHSSDLVVSNNYSYVINAYDPMYISIVDISRSPNLLENIKFEIYDTDSVGGFIIKKYGNTFFIGGLLYYTSGNSLFITDLIDSLNITLANIKYLFIEDTYLYIMTINNIYIYSIKDTFNIQLLSNIPGSYNYGGADIYNKIQIYRNYMYVITNNIIIYDISDKYNPVYLSTIVISSAEHSNIIISEPYLYITNSGFLYILIYSISDPSNPILLTSQNRPGDIYGNKHIISGNYLYSSFFNDYYLSKGALIFNIENIYDIQSNYGGFENRSLDINGNYIHIVNLSRYYKVDSNGSVLTNCLFNDIKTSFIDTINNFNVQNIIGYSHLLITNDSYTNSLVVSKNIVNITDFTVLNTTFNYNAGTINILNATLSSGILKSIIINSNKIFSNSIITTSIKWNNTGIPIIYISDISNGSFQINIKSIGNLTNDVLTVSFISY